MWEKVSVRDSLAWNFEIKFLPLITKVWASNFNKLLQLVLVTTTRSFTHFHLHFYSIAISKMYTSWPSTEWNKCPSISWWWCSTIATSRYTSTSASRGTEHAHTQSSQRCKNQSFWQTVFLEFKFNQGLDIFLECAQIQIFKFSDQMT